MCDRTEGLCRCVQQFRKFKPTISVSREEGLVCDQQERDSHCKFACKLLCCQYCSFCNRVSTKERCTVNPSFCYHCQKIKCVKYVSCVGHLNSVKFVTNAPTVAPDLSVGARLHQFWEKWAALGASHMVTVLRRLHPPLPVPTKFHQASNSHKLLCKSPQEQLLVGGIASASEQKCSGTGSNSKSSGVLQQAIFSTQTQQPVDTYLGP